MAIFPEGRWLSKREVEDIKTRIEHEYNATDVVFLSQNGFSCKYKGLCKGVITDFDYDKNSQFIIEITE